MKEQGKPEGSGCRTWHDWHAPDKATHPTHELQPEKKTEVDLYMGVSLNGGTTISHPQMIIFSRSLPMVVGETHHLRKHPYMGIYYLEDHPG